MEINAATATVLVAMLLMLCAIGKFLMSLITKPIKELGQENKARIDVNKDHTDDRIDSHRDDILGRVSELKNEIVRLSEAEEKNYKYAKDISERVGRIDSRVQSADQRSSDNNADLKTKEAKIERMRSEISKLFELSDEIKEKMTDLSVIVAKEGRV